MAIKYRADYEGIGEYILRAPWMVEEMHSRIKRCKELAEASAPVYEAGPHPGRYKASFLASADIRGGKKPRACGLLTNFAPEALAVEFGTENNEAHHTLVRSLDGAGGSGGSAVIARRDGGSKARQARRIKNAKARERRAAKKAQP